MWVKSPDLFASFVEEIKPASFREVAVRIVGSNVFHADLADEVGALLCHTGHAIDCGRSGQPRLNQAKKLFAGHACLPPFEQFRRRLSQGQQHPILGRTTDKMASHDKQEDSMNHSTCDGCGAELLPASAVRYEVRIEVEAAYDPLGITAEDLQKDHRAEIAKILEQLKGLSATEAENQVYRRVDFDLCPACQRRYLSGLLSGVFLPE